MDGTPNVPITEGDQTLLLMPQAFENDATLEVSMTVGKDEYTFNAKLKDIVREWKAGKTYTYKISDRLSDILKVDLNFFKGQGYTQRLISANGDPYTIDITYPNPNYVKKVTARFIYAENDVIQDNIDLTNKTSMSSTSLCMNNLGQVNKAKSWAVGFQVQIKIESDIKVNITSNVFSENQVYNPATDNGKWYSIWSGTMYPPNYVSWGVIMSRSNLPFSNYAKAVENSRNYFEIHESHPKYGRGKWALPTGKMNSVNEIHRMDELADMIDKMRSPGGNSLYGNPPDKRDRHWTQATYPAVLEPYAWCVTYHNGRGYSYDYNQIKQGLLTWNLFSYQFCIEKQGMAVWARAQIEP